MENSLRDSIPYLHPLAGCPAPDISAVGDKLRRGCLFRLLGRIAKIHKVQSFEFFYQIDHLVHDGSLQLNRPPAPGNLRFLLVNGNWRTTRR